MSARVKVCLYFAPPGLIYSSLGTSGSRRGLYYSAAPRLISFFADELFSGWAFFAGKVFRGRGRPRHTSLRHTQVKNGR
jgi:hypothetical protein